MSFFSLFFFFFNDTATTEIYTLSLHDALPISLMLLFETWPAQKRPLKISQHARIALPSIPLLFVEGTFEVGVFKGRSEEHTSELQSLAYLVCRLLLEKKKKKKKKKNKLEKTQ